MVMFQLSEQFQNVYIPQKPTQFTFIPQTQWVQQTTSEKVALRQNNNQDRHVCNNFRQNLAFIPFKMKSFPF